MTERHQWVFAVQVIMLLLSGFAIAGALSKHLIAALLVDCKSKLLVLLLYGPSCC